MSGSAAIDLEHMARLLDVTPQHLRQLVQEGVLFYAPADNDYESHEMFQLVPTVRAYIQYLRKPLTN